MLHFLFVHSRYLASGSGDTTVRFWDVNTETPHFQCKGTAQELERIGVCDFKDANGTLHFFPFSFAFIPFLGHKNWILSIAWSPDGKKLASGCKDGKVWPDFCLFSLGNGRRHWHQKSLKKIALKLGPKQWLWKITSEASDSKRTPYSQNYHTSHQLIGWLGDFLLWEFFHVENESFLIDCKNDSKGYRRSSLPRLIRISRIWFSRVGDEFWILKTELVNVAVSTLKRHNSFP